MAIYVLRSNGLLKIGFSDNLRKRVLSLIAASHVPIELVGHMPGGREVEDHLHGVFAGYRETGEWFRETDEMRSVFAVILTPHLPEVKRSSPLGRRDDSAALSDLSDALKLAAARRWPTANVAKRVRLMSEELGWNWSRAKDLYYADPRMVLRGSEQKEIEFFLTQNGERNV